MKQARAGLGIRRQEFEGATAQGGHQAPPLLGGTGRWLDQVLSRRATSAADRPPPPPPAPPTSRAPDGDEAEVVAGLKLLGRGNLGGVWDQGLAGVHLPPSLGGHCRQETR